MLLVHSALKKNKIVYIHERVVLELSKRVKSMFFETFLFRVIIGPSIYLEQYTDQPKILNLKNQTVPLQNRYLHFFKLLEHCALNAGAE